MMVQAMLAIDDLFVVTPEAVKDLFLDDIETYFKANEIYCSIDYTMIGKTGNMYKYDFHFQRTKNAKERFCKGINKLDKQRRDLTLFNWMDTTEQHTEVSELIVIYNDENSVSDDVLLGFFSYGIKTMPFSKRQEPNNLRLFA